MDAARWQAQKPQSTKRKVEQTPILRGSDNLVDMCKFLGVKLGKKPQEKSDMLDPKSPYYNKDLAKRRAKEKARRKAHARQRIYDK